MLNMFLAAAWVLANGVLIRLAWESGRDTGDDAGWHRGYNQGHARGLLDAFATRNVEPLDATDRAILEALRAFDDETIH